MKKSTLLLLAVILLGIVAPIAQARHHKVAVWLSALSADTRARLRAAKKEAMKDPAVHAAYDRKAKADAEYHQLLHREMLRADPSLRPLIEEITRLQEKNDF